MEIINVEISQLYISNINVRKTLTGKDDETNITDLSNDINVNGLINPITVRFNPLSGQADKGVSSNILLLNEGKYEIIAGQRRYLAMKQLNKTHIPCHILKINDQKAEEISLIENVQRNQMTTCDKIKAYARLYDVYKGDIDKVMNAIHVSRPTIMKYLKLRKLPDNIIKLLDTTGKNKLSIDVVLELTKLPENVDKTAVLAKIQSLSNIQKLEALKHFKNQGNEISELEEIKDNIGSKQIKSKVALEFPYVYDTSADKNIQIPVNLFNDIVELIKNKTNRNICYC